MKRILAPILLLTLLFPSIAMGETVKWDDLKKWDGLYYKKSSGVPFTGKTTVTGKTLGEIQGTFRNGKKHGPSVSYWDNGQVFRTGTFKDGKEDGPFVGYYKNGQLRNKGTYEDGKMDGPWVSYYKNGRLGYKGTFKDGKKVGPWVHYNEDGTVWKSLTGTYKNGVKVK